MVKIAIDIAVLPPQEIMDKVIAINRREAERGNAHGRLAKNDFYPHISIAMGTIKQENLDEIKIILDNLLKNQKPLSVELVELYYAVGSDGSKTYGLKMKKTKEIQNIHEKLMRSLVPYFSYDATIEDLYKKENDEEKTNHPDHINKYLNHSFENFDPHLTLRCKEVETAELPIIFTASTIAICHVGTRTTCRKILFQKTLK